MQAECHDSSCIYSPTFLCVHCEVEKRNHFLMNNSFNTQCNLTKNLVLLLLMYVTIDVTDLISGIYTNLHTFLV